MTETPQLPIIAPATWSQRFWHHLLRLFGWSVRGHIPTAKKYVIIVAPHTSNWDWFILFAASRSFALPFSYWIGKHTIFRWPLGPIFRALGGIPINRSRSTNFVDQISHEFERRAAMSLALTPEGTRRKTEFWKSGFYQIAQQAQVPVVMTYLDYARREIGVSEPFALSHDVEADMAVIRGFYQGTQGRHPEKQGPIRLRPTAS